MIEQDDLEMIHRAIDGEIGVDEQADLERLLEGSPEARSTYDDLNRVDGLLKKLPTQNLPAGLHDDIVGAIALPAPQVSAANEDAWPAFLRYGLAASFGLIVAVGFYESRPYAPGPDADRLVGTIAPPARDEATTTDAIAIDADGFNGVVRLERRQGTDILDVSWSSEDPVDIVVDLSASGLRYEALAQLQSDLAFVAVEGQTLRLRGRGQQHMTARLGRDASGDKQDASVALEVLRDGTLIDRGRLTVN